MANSREPVQRELPREVGHLIEEGDGLVRAGEAQKASSAYERCARILINFEQYELAAEFCGRLLLLDPASTTARSIREGLRTRELLDGEQLAQATRRGQEALQKIKRAPRLDLAAAIGFPIGDELVAQTWIRDFSAGDAIVLEGEAGDRLFFVIQGMAAASRRSLGGREIEIEVLGPGSCFGELALLGDGRYHASVKARSALTVIGIPFQEARRLMRRSALASRRVRGSYRSRLQSIFLSTSPLAMALGREVAEEVISACQPIAAKQGQTLIVQGERPAGLYLVLLGKLEVVASVSGGRDPIHLGELQDGDFCGEMSLLSQQDLATATVRATSFVQALFLDRIAFARLVIEHPRLAQILQAKAEQRRISNDRVVGRYQRNDGSAAE
jgi:CRP-like cAMP-binding protein